MVVGRHFLVCERCHGRGARRPADDHVNGGGAAGDEVGARAYTAQHDEVKGFGLGLGSLPHRGAPVHPHANADIAQVAGSQVGESALPLVVNVTLFVRRYLNAQRLVGLAHFHLLAVDGGFLAIDGGRRAGIVHDGEHGVHGYLLELLARVEVDVTLKDVNAEVVGLALLEQRISIHVVVAVGRIAHHLYRVDAIVEVGDGNDLLAEGSVLLTILPHGDARGGAKLAYHLGTIGVVVVDAIHFQGVFLHLLRNGVGGI